MENEEYIPQDLSEKRGKGKKKEGQGLRQKSIQNTFWSTGTTFASRVGGLIFSVIIARLLFPELFGIYTLALTIILVIVTLADSGINTTIARFVSDSLKSSTKKSKADARARFSYLFRLKIIISAIIAFILFVLADFIALYIFSEPLLTLPLRIGAFYLIAISIQGSLKSVFLAIQKLNYQTYNEIINQIVRIVLVIILLGFYLTVEIVFIALIMTTIITILVFYFALYREYPDLLDRDKSRMRREEKNRMLSFFGWSSITIISLAFFTKIDTFMLGIFMPSEFIGYYTAIFSIVWSVFALLSFSGALLPVFTQIRKKGLEHAFQEVLRYVFLISIPATVGLAFVIVPMIRVIYGLAYIPSEYIFSITLTAGILSFLVFESVLSSLYSVLFQSREKPRILARVIVVATILNIFLNYIFITQAIVINISYGIIGAALATFISRYGKLAGLVYNARTKLKIRAFSSSSVILKPIFASLIMSIFLFISLIMFDLRIYWLALIIPLAVLIYFVSLWSVRGIGKDDINIARDVIKKIKLK